MWSLIKSLLLKWALLKWLLKSLGSLGILVPIAFVLKMVGLPVLMVLAGFVLACSQRRPAVTVFDGARPPLRLAVR